MTVLRYEDYEQERSFDADVVVIGTGAGGAVAGALLAEAGYSVLFVEEGAYHRTESFNPYVTESVPRLYRDASATVIMGAPPIPYIEGRCVGGSTTINGGMTWRAPERVTRHWAEKSGLSELSGRALEPLFAQIEEDISARPQSPESIGEDSRIMREGAEKLGWSYLHNHRNQHGCVGANNCVLGCPTGAKQSTLVSYLPRAFAKGAHCLTEVRVERLMIEGGRCVGVTGVSIDRRTRAQPRKLRIRGRAVIVACGAIQTPLLLQAHRLGRPSKLLGKNFTCHPNVKVLAVYPFELRAWKGVSQAGQIREFEARGIKLAENMVPPGALASQLPFHGSEAWELLQDYNRMALTGVLIEDSTTGSVARAPFGLGGARYALTDYDHERLLEGVKRLAELHFSMGATKVLLPFAHMHLCHSVDELQKITPKTIKKSTLDMFTVHLMGTAQIGSRAEQSVVDPSGQLWDLPGCYVADASLFPSAVGVNPQVSIMALAMLVASRVRVQKTSVTRAQETAHAAAQ
jgi:choline dehydrogenase-like flavoprotein